MTTDDKLMEMLTAYAAAHQHPVNVAIHMVGIPTIMFGILIPLSWAKVWSGSVEINLAQILVVGFFLFYVTLDRVFAIAFFLAALLLAELARRVGGLPLATSGAIAALAFIGGYAAQFVGHAVEKSAPVLVKNPLQANLAAPFFTVVEVFKLLGLRDALLRRVQARIAVRQEPESHR